MRRFKKITAILLAMIMTVALLTPAMNANMLPENIPLAREILGEGMVLLKNENNALPLKSTDTIAVFGQGQRWVNSTSQGYQIGGGGSGNLTPGKTPVGPIDALLAAEEEGRIKLYHPLVDAYQNAITYSPNAAMYEGAAAAANKAIMFISRFSSEGSDRSTGKGDWLLSDAETAMMKELSARFEDVIILANVGGVIDTSWAVGDVDGIDIESLVMVWQGGMEGGNGICDLLLGDVNPSGKLVDTYAKDINDYPSTDGFYNSAFVDYSEDVFVGYRYFETFDPNYEKVNYEFGFGLSYTTFEFSNVAYSTDGKNITVGVDVTNTGNVAGKEVVQVYFSAPQMGTGSAVLSKPAKELAAFDKTDLLEPGATERITLSFPINDMATFDDTGLTGNESAYVLEAGNYDVYVGNSVRNAGTRKAGTYTQEELKVTEQYSKLVAPKRLKERLLADGTYENLFSASDYQTISATEMTKIEGESYVDSGPNVRLESFTADGATGQCVAYMNYKDEYVTYNIVVEKTGLYDMRINYANGRALIKDMANIYINDVKQPNIIFNAPQTGDGDGAKEWYNFADSEIIPLYLEEGVSEFKIATKNTSFVNFDYFTITPHTATTITAKEPVMFQAEYFDDCGTTTDVLPTREWFPNGNYPANLKVGEDWVSYEGGCLAYMHAAGNWVSYNLYVEEAGTYNLQFRMSNGRAQVNNVATIAVDGVDSGINLTCPQTGVGDDGEWYNFVDIDTIYTIDLPAGNTVLTITSKTTNFPNIDQITIAKKHTIGANPVTKIEGESYSSSTGKAAIEEYNVFQEGKSGKCVAFLDVIGSSVTYDMSCAEAGEYDLTLCMANGYDAKDLTAEIVINGDEAKVQKLTFNCPRTGEAGATNRWYNFVELKAGKVTLPAGDFKLTLRADHTAFLQPGQVEGSTGGFANVEYMLFTAPQAPAVMSFRSSGAAVAPIAGGEEDYVIQLKDVYEETYTMDEFLAQMTIEELASFATGYAAGIGQGTGSIGGSNAVVKKYGIARADTADGPGGLRLNSKSTGWGCEMLTGCTWNQELAEVFGAAVGKEARASKVDIWLAPGMNIHRNPMCGRNFEYYSEDPLVTGKMAAAVSRGVQSFDVAVTIKHFAGNNKEGNRNSSDSRITERALREIYLRGFEIAIKEGDSWCVMSSYNFINGIETSENPELLIGILRDEWGFDGFVMTDWGNQSNIVKEVQAGNNVKMSSGDPTQLVAAYNAGTITRELLEQNAAQMLYVLMKLPDFSAEPVPPTISKISSTAPTKVEAETYFDSFEKVQIEVGEVTNVAYMDQKDDDGNFASYVSYKLNVEKAGTYDLMFRAANNVAGTDILELSLDGVIYEDIIFNNPSTGGWQVYVDRQVGTIYLPAGEHTLKIKSKGNFGNLDYFVLTPNTIDPSGNTITAPESVMKNETFDVIINTTEDYGKLRMENEVGRAVGFSITEKTANEDGSFTTKVNLWLGTAGTGRTISVYADGVKLGDFTLDILAPPPTPDGIYEIEAPKSAEAGQSFQVTVTTTKNLIKGSFWNETGRGIGRTIDQRIYDGEMLKTVYSLVIGTPSKEARTISVRADYNGCSDWPFEKSFDILITAPVA